MNKINLHGVKHEDVPNTVKRFLEDNWNLTDDQVEIITGHSSIMKRIVSEVLDSYRLNFLTKGPSILVFM